SRRVSPPRRTSSGKNVCRTLDRSQLATGGTDRSFGSRLTNPGSMHGPALIARSLSTPGVRDAFGNQWQYHSRSDRHSRIACWGMLFDLLRNCPTLLDHVGRGHVGFGINHEMRDFRTNRKKNLDLVVCTPAGTVESNCETLEDLVEYYEIILSPSD